MDRERVVVAEIIRTRGTRGEVVAQPQTDVPGRMKTLRGVRARLKDGSDVPLEVIAAWEHKGQWVLEFVGIDSIESAERLRGADVWVPQAERGVLESGDFFQSDLIGCRLIDRLTGQAVGIVEGWQQYGGPPLMEVEAGGRQVLVPFVRSLCEVDLAQRTIRADLPEGLLEL